MVSMLLTGTLSSAQSTVSPATNKATSPSDGGGFDAAMQAAQKAAAEKDADNQTIADIRKKGFVAWARDAQIKNLKEELRKKALAAMGLDEKSLAALPPSVHNIIEQRLEQELALQMAQNNPVTDKTARDGNSSTSTGQTGQDSQNSNAPQPLTQVSSQSDDTGQNQPSKNNQAGKTFPVIPALIWPGGESVL